MASMRRGRGDCTHRNIRCRGSFIIGEYRKFLSTPWSIYKLIGNIPESVRLVKKVGAFSTLCSKMADNYVPLGVLINCCLVELWAKMFEIFEYISHPPNRIGRTAI